MILFKVEIIHCIHTIKYRKSISNQCAEFKSYSFGNLSSDYCDLSVPFFSKFFRKVAIELFSLENKLVHRKHSPSHKSNHNSYPL